jgi:hypothetical protein
VLVLDEHPAKSRTDAIKTITFFITFSYARLKNSF